MHTKQVIEKEGHQSFKRNTETNNNTTTTQQQQQQYTKQGIKKVIKV